MKGAIKTNKWGTGVRVLQKERRMKLACHRKCLGRPFEKIIVEQRPEGSKGTSHSVILEENPRQREHRVQRS